MIPSATIERFRLDLSRLRPSERDAPVLVAVSGGADSLALLLLTHAVLGDRCVAATVDHGIREAAAGEAEGVAALCRARGIAHRVLTGEMAPRVDGTANLSTRARELRYRLLEAERRRTGAGWILTAHHADDQLETVLMRLNRGAGVAGLAGIRERNGRVLRPLLEWPHAALAAIVTGEGLEPVADPSNEDERYDRARLRRVLRDMAWFDSERAAFSAHLAGAADEALDWAADALFDRYCRLGDGIAWHYQAVIPKELHRRMIARCVRHVDPLARCDMTGLSRFMLALMRGDAATIGGVAATVCERDDVGRQGRVWRLRRAPPRRSL